MARTAVETLGPLVREQVIVEGRTLVIMRPQHTELPAFRSRPDPAEPPYWTELWPAARMLAKAILRESWPPGLEALEIGCGLGLPGIAALACGLHVTFTDCDQLALEFAAANARLNGYDAFTTLRLDWRSPLPRLQVPVLLGSDLVYDLSNVTPVVAFIRHTLAPDGVCLLTDQERVPPDKLRSELISASLSFTTETIRAGEPGGRRSKGTLYRIRHAAASNQPL
jgi:predicted nicotinamide N-methyase